MMLLGMCCGVKLAFGTFGELGAACGECGDGWRVALSLSSYSEGDLHSLNDSCIVCIDDFQVQVSGDDRRWAQDRENVRIGARDPLVDVVLATLE